MPDYPALSFSVFRFTLKARETLYLPPYKGSALRGGFGHIFKRVVCVQPQVSHCDGCLLTHQCAYAYLFETSPPPDSEVLRTHEAIPRPFVIRPPLDRRTRIPAGEHLDFELVLIGQAVDFLPHFLVVFRELGEAGLGRRRGKYILQQVQAVCPLTGEDQAVFDGEMLLGMGKVVLAEDVATWAARLPTNQLVVRFQTPARLKHSGEFARDTLPFHILLRALVRRLSSLAYFHCGGRWETDYAGWVKRARAVDVSEARLEWVDWERQSGRQGRRIGMGGLVGSVTYAGDLEPFGVLLALGQWVHVGKGTVFGNGQYTLGGG